MASAIPAVRLDGLSEVDLCGSAFGRLPHLSGASFAAHLRRNFVRALLILLEHVA